MDLRYNIHAFRWDPVVNAFFVENPIFGIHPITREQFYIVNEDTKGFRRFRYIKEVGFTVMGGFTITADHIESFKEFESEDGIRCYIKILNN
jgi:hypothetical protein